MAVIKTIKDETLTALGDAVRNKSLNSKYTIYEDKKKGKSI